MNSYAKRLDQKLKIHDSLLFVKETKLGRYDVYRKSGLGGSLPHFIFSLTDDWTVKTIPVEWGIDVVINRIKAHDIWRDDKFVDKLIESHEKYKEGQNRDRRNSIESFLYDFRSQFHKATNEINTSTLNKIHKEA